MEIVLATGNSGKVKEIKSYFSDLNINYLSLKDFNIPPIIEDGKTLTDNAIIKAKAVSELTNKIALADDTGLFVDAINGEPGVYSARFAGEFATYDDNNTKLLKLLANIPNNKRTAHFECVMALYYPSKKTHIVNGICNGIILDTLKGENGFGYDPIFYIPEVKKTFAEINLQEKNRISHRAKAMIEMKKYLKNIT